MATAQRRKDLYRRKVEEFEKELGEDGTEMFFDELRQMLGDPAPIPLFEFHDEWPEKYIAQWAAECAAWEGRNTGGKRLLARYSPPPRKKSSRRSQT